MIPLPKKPESFKPYTNYPYEEGWNMQAIIMAAGKGSRLGEITQGKPKSFAEIKGIRLIDYNIALLRHHGIKPIIIVTGFCSEAFEKAFDGAPDIEFVFNPFYDHANVIGSFWAGMHRLKDGFIFIHADSICDPCLFEELIKTPGDIVLPVDRNTYNEEAMGVRCRDGRVVEISKNIPVGEADGEFIGLAKISNSLLPQIKEEAVTVLKNKQYTEYFEAAIQRVIDKQSHNIVTLPTNGRFWAEIDFIEDYEKAVQEIPDSLVQLAMKQRHL
jgi:choline kinase